MRLSEELTRIVAGRRRRRSADQAPRQIVPSAPQAPGHDGAHAGAGDPFDAARERLRTEIPPRAEDE